VLKSLKFLWQDFVAFMRLDFKLLPYIYALTIIALSIVIAYTTKFGASVVDGTAPFSNKYVNKILMYSALYFLVAVPVLIFQGKYKSINKSHFYLKGFVLTAMVGFNSAFSWRDYLNFPMSTFEEQRYFFKFLFEIKGLLIQLPVLLILRFWIDKQVKGLYGICRGNNHIKAYMWLFLLMMPILITISFTPDFLSYYPMGKPWQFGADTALSSKGLFGYSIWAHLLTFEIAYISAFFIVEVVYRGAFVIGMGTTIGRSAVLPMVAVYVAIHFGKPVMETISSIFGGFALGVLAYQTKHIWGGVIIHMGIALAIEVIRLLQYYILGI